MSLVNWTNRPMFPTANSMFDNFFTKGDDYFRALAQGTSVPAVNVVESEKSFEVNVAAPGKDKEDFKIEIDNNVLCISSESEESNEETKENYTRQEYNYNSFSRSFTLPENAQEEDVKATYENGVLKIEIAKKEPSVSATKSISIS